VNKRLLLIDDEETILFALARYFRRIGYTVDTARELEEAEALATYTDYSVVIADLSLTDSGYEGLEILRYLRCLRLSLPRLRSSACLLRSPCSSP